MGRSANERSIVTPYKRHDPSGQPPMPHGPYQSTLKRSPSQPLIYLPHTLSEITGPVYGHGEIGEADNDLTKHHKEDPQGERIISRAECSTVAHVRFHTHWWKSGRPMQMAGMSI